MRAIGVLAAVIAIAQAQQPSEQERPTFRTGANLVRVDATVINRRGNPVNGLTAEDFAVFEDGVPQRIQSFKFVGATGFPAPGDNVSLAIRSPEHAAAEAARDEVRVFLLFWDDYHIGEMEGALRGRRTLETFVLSQFGPTDLVAIMDPLTPLDAIRFTRDRRALADGIRRLRGRRGVYFPPRSAAEEEHLRASIRGRQTVEAIRAQVTASALEGAAIHLGTLREGRKSIIFVSESLGWLGSDTTTVLRALTHAANANNTAIYTLDPRGLGPPASSVLKALSDATGARAIVNTNEPLGALKQIVEQASAYYLLGYASSHNPIDGKFHQIDVRMRSPGLEVHARKGYWAPSGADVERARTEAIAAPPEVTMALGALSGSRGDMRLFDLWIGLSQRAGGGADVTVAWSPRPIKDAAAEPARVTLKATTADGRQCFDGPIPDRHVSFAAPPGPLRVQVAAMDSEDAIVDRDTRQITVPDYGTALAISEPMVVRLQSAKDARTLLRDPAAPPFAGREFSRTDRVLIRFAVYGEARAAAAVAARLISRRGAPLVGLKADRFDAAEDTFQIDLPLSSVARGEYVVAIDVSRGEDHAQALVPLRVVQ